MEPLLKSVTLKFKFGEVPADVAVLLESLVKQMTKKIPELHDVLADAVNHAHKKEVTNNLAQRALVDRKRNKRRSLPLKKESLADAREPVDPETTVVEMKRILQPLLNKTQTMNRKTPGDAAADASLKTVLKEIPTKNKENVVLARNAKSRKKCLSIILIVTSTSAISLGESKMMT
jgi:hypothetical protein